MNESEMGEMYGNGWQLALAVACGCAWPANVAWLAVSGSVR